MPESVTVVAQYRVRSGAEQEFLSVLAQHWPALRALELVTDHPAQVYLGGEQGVDGPFVVELFEWATADASRRAPTHPSVSAIWEAMEPLCEARGGRPSMEFPHLHPVTLPARGSRGRSPRSEGVGVPSGWHEHRGTGAEPRSEGVGGPHGFPKSK